MLSDVQATGRWSRLWWHTASRLSHRGGWAPTTATALNELTALGCRLVELVEPALPLGALAENDAGPGAEAYLELPNFIVIACRR